MAASARKRTEVFDSRVHARKRFKSRPSLAALHDELSTAYVKYGLEDLPDGTVRLKCRPGTEATIFETTGGISVEDIAHIAQPVTVGGGDPEASMLAALAAGTAAGIPRAQHIAYAEKPHGAASGPEPPHL